MWLMRERKTIGKEKAQKNYETKYYNKPGMFQVWLVLERNKFKTLKGKPYTLSYTQFLKRELLTNKKLWIS